MSTGEEVGETNSMRINICFSIIIKYKNIEKQIKKTQKHSVTEE